MRLRSALLLVSSLFVLGAGDRAWAVREVRGNTPSGAAFAITAPDTWHPGDPLLFVNHGFDFEIDTHPDFGPLADAQLAQGYAIAASGFRQRGWALFTALDDNFELLQRFRGEFGEPGRLLIAGGSMGGLISLKQAEDPRFPRVDGVYALCPPAAGARTWDTAIDLRLIYDVVCEGVGGGELPNGAQPMPWAYNLDDIPQDLGDLTGNSDLLRAFSRVNQCTGLIVHPLLRTPPQRNRLQRLKDLSGITDDDFLQINLAYSIFGLSDLVRAPDKLNNRNPFDTRQVNYGAVDVDAQIPRFGPDPLAAFDFARSSTLTGGGTAKILSIHTSQDQLVSPAHQFALRAAYAPGRVVNVIAAETEPSHCDFSSAELRAGWESLRTWIAGGVAPTSSGVQQSCRTLVTGGVVAGECRLTGLDEARAAELDQRMRPRPVLQQTLASMRSAGLWFDPARSGEGWFLEPQADGRVVVTAYSYPPVGAPGAQRWLIGDGHLQANGFSADALIETRGGGFAGQFDPAQVQLLPWGSARFAFDGADRATLDYRGPATYGSAQRSLVRLSGFGWSGVAANGSPLPSPPVVRASGAYFDPTHSGEGIFLHGLPRTAADLGNQRVVVLWYTYDAAGLPMWLIAQGAVAGDGSAPDSLRAELDIVLRPTGARFGAAFNPADVRNESVGRITLNLLSCTAVRLRFTPNAGGGLPTADLTLTRLSQPIGADCSSLLP